MSNNTLDWKLCRVPLYPALFPLTTCQWLLWHLILLLVIYCIPFYNLSADNDNLQLNCLSHLNLKVSPLLWAYWDLWHWCTWNLSQLYVASLPGHYKKISPCHELSHFSWHFSRCLKPHCVHVHTCAWCIELGHHYLTSRMEHPPVLTQGGGICFLCTFPFR